MRMGGGDQNLEEERGGWGENHDDDVWLNRSLGFYLLQFVTKTKDLFVCWGGGGVSGLEFDFSWVKGIEFIYLLDLASPIHLVPLSLSLSILLFTYSHWIQSRA